YRPFNNVYELLLVPTVSSSRLLARNTNANTGQRNYYGYQDAKMRTSAAIPAVYDGSNPQQVPYPHLLNFFESKQSSQLGAGNPNASAQLQRLFSYLGVPSLFANAYLQINPASAAASPNHSFPTPYRVSRYREPGMINLNTVTSSDVLF